MRSLILSCLFLFPLSLFAQYCVPYGMGGACISQVTIGSYVNTTTTCIAGSYSSYTASYPLTIGVPQSVIIETNTNSLEGIWIDWNHDMIFSSSEFIGTTSSAVIDTIYITPPMTVQPTLTRMRIRNRLPGNLITGTMACDTMGSGETEDYDLVIAGPLGTTNMSLNQVERSYVYPNPCIHECFISHKEGGQLYSMDGKFIKHLHEGRNDLSDIHEGFYFVLMGEEKQKLVILRK